jgi:hypothetical protein
MKSAGYRPRKEVSGVATVRSSDLDKRAIAREKTLLVIFAKSHSCREPGYRHRARAAGILEF